MMEVTTGGLVEAVSAWALDRGNERALNREGYLEICDARSVALCTG